MPQMHYGTLIESFGKWSYFIRTSPSNVGKSHLGGASMARKIECILWRFRLSPAWIRNLETNKSWPRRTKVRSPKPRYSKKFRLAGSKRTWFCKCKSVEPFLPESKSWWPVKVELSFPLCHHFLFNPTKKLRMPNWLVSKTVLRLRF